MAEKRYINPYTFKVEQTVEEYKNGTYDHRYSADWEWYKKVENPEEWEPCPRCGLRPRVWEFNNGRGTMCACMREDDPYNPYCHFSINAESIASVVLRSPNKQSAKEYDVDALRKNWNEWARTGKIVFDHDKEYKENHKW